MDNLAVTKPTLSSQIKVAKYWRFLNKAAASIALRSIPAETFT